VLKVRPAELKESENQPSTSFKELWGGGWWVGWCIWIITSALGPGLVKSQMSSAKLDQPG